MARAGRSEKSGGLVPSTIAGSLRAAHEIYARRKELVPSAAEAAERVPRWDEFVPTGKGAQRNRIGHLGPSRPIEPFLAANIEQNAPSA